MTVAVSPVAVPPPFCSSQNRVAEVSVNPVRFPKRSLISDIHAKTNLGALRVILRTRVENTARDWDLFSTWAFRGFCDTVTLNLFIAQV